jgi:hypothetical protein
LPDAIPYELAVHHPIPGTSWSSFGALLIVVGAVLVVGDAASGGPAWGGTYAEPKGRAAVTLALVGSLLVVAGSSVLLAQGGVSLLAAGVVIGAAAVMTFVGMAYNLKQHLDLVERTTPCAPHRSLWWCLWHPLWRPPPT